MATAPNQVTIHLLADHVHLIPSVARMRWQEWGHPPEPSDPEWWTGSTAREAGRITLPVTWVAIDDHGDALGAVGLAEFDIAERREHSPWLIGMIVRADYRGQGIGGRPVARLEGWARSQGHAHLWVATGGRAVAFYQKCGWHLVETFQRTPEDITTVLTRTL